jgi:predicted transcriptional regulator
MDDFEDVERWVLDDGRRVEKRITEVKDEDGQGERTIELHIEDERPLRLQKRVKEKTKPFVFERTIETLDVKTGQVVEQKVESIDPKVQMQLVEHISTNAPAVSVLNVENDCHVTKEEMIEAIVAAVKAVKDQPSDFSNKLNSLGIADEIQSRAEVSGYSASDKILLGIIAAQIIGLCYIVFFM